MTKFNEITDHSERATKIDFVNELWANWREVRTQTLKRIASYLFLLNTGALLASLTYVATKQANSYIHLSIWLFSAGTFLSVLHATLDYYLTEYGFTRYQKDVEELYANKINWVVFVDRTRHHNPFDKLLHTLGWLGGIAFFTGLVIGVRQI